jgi:hypothetical protein
MPREEPQDQEKNDPQGRPRRAVADNLPFVVFSFQVAILAVLAKTKGVEGTEKEIDTGSSVLSVYSCSNFSFVSPSIRQDKEYGKKMEGKKIAGCMRISIDHFFATRFFCQIKRRPHCQTNSRMPGRVCLIAAQDCC